MRSNGDWMAFLLIAIGIWTIVDGIRVRLGIWKGWFVVARVPTVVIPSFVFGFIPAGLAFVAMGLLALGRVFGLISDPAIAQDGLLWVVMPLLGLSILLAGLQPRWILPDWYRWLRDNHGDIMRLLKHEARQNRMWHARVSTQEGLEQWATEVRHKRWLKSRYDPDTVAFMLAEARLDDGWTERVSTEAGLAAWAEEMAAQYRERRQARRE